jgi:hypothetical protein
MEPQAQQEFKVTLELLGQLESRDCKVAQVLQGLLAAKVLQDQLGCKEVKEQQELLALKAQQG